MIGYLIGGGILFAVLATAAILLPPLIRDEVRWGRVRRRVGAQGRRL